MAERIHSRRGGRGKYRTTVRGVSKPRRYRDTLPEYLMPEQIVALQEHAADPRARLLITLMWRAGLRVSEATGVSPAHVRRPESGPATLTVRDGKGGKDRVIPLHAELDTALRIFERHARPRLHDPYLDIDRRTAHRWIMKVYLAAMNAGALPAGLAVHPHIFRHSAGTFWANQGIPITTVQAWMGHASLKDTERYTHAAGVGAEHMEGLP